eukprot:scaffold27941_cov58-Phaeocystis_antarctica.AAC.4
MDAYGCSMDAYGCSLRARALVALAKPPATPGAQQRAPQQRRAYREDAPTRHQGGRRRNTRSGSSGPLGT